MPYFNYDYSSFQPESILIYLRKSRSDDPMLSVEEVLEKHETILREWTDKNLSGPIPDENIYREVVSGETIDDRPEMLKLLRMIESPKIKAVLVVEVQRLSRGDLEDAGRLIKLLRYTDTLVITPPKTYDLRDDYDRDFFERELKRGNEFLEYQKRIMTRGRLLSVSQGNFIGSKPPYGYDRAFVMDGKRRCPTLAINEQEAAVVRMIFDMYVNQNMGYASIALRLDSLGFKPRKNARWSKRSIIGVLTNIHYIGKVEWYRRKTVAHVEDMEVIKKRTEQSHDKCLVYDGRHEAIISEELFNAAQDKMGKNPRQKAGFALKNPLAGIVYCQCGHVMVMRSFIKDGKEYANSRFVCNNQFQCHTSSCLASELLDRVRDILRERIDDFTLKLQANTQDSAEQHDAIIRQLENRLASLEQKEISQWEKYSEESMPKEIFEKLNEKVLREKDETKTALQKAREAIPQKEYYENLLLRFHEALAAMDNPDATAEQKNILLKACIERITYYRSTPVQQKGSFYGRNSSWVYNDPNIILDVKLRV